MTAEICPATVRQVKQLVPKATMTQHDIVCLLRCSQAATKLWICKIDDDVVCVVGLVPPTIIADYAYLWLHVTEGFDGHEFIFVRHSQIMMQQALKEFQYIYGHCERKNKKAQRWIKWLGGKFGQSSEDLIPFVFERKNG